MKISYVSKAVVLFLLLAVASPAFATTHPKAVHEDAAVRARVLEGRLAEIEAIDKKALSKDEKKALRHEVKEIKKELAAVSGGIYLSIGAILLIALLLILLL